MHPNAALIERFYKAFQKRDAAAMGACYAPNVRFCDPVFRWLEGDRARGMWTMLCERGKDLQLEYSGIEADDTTGRAHWDARYTFSKTGRKVLNQIDASFKFDGGLIVEHVDHFNLYKWAKQALGPTGVLLGWTPMVQGAVRKQAKAGLDEFMKRA
jgi:ketosteroid isomerase-like protein